MISYNKNTYPGSAKQGFNRFEMGSKDLLQDKGVAQKTPDLGFLEYLAEGVVIVDRERIIRAVNSALVRMVGWREDELIGRRCLDLFRCQQPVTATSLCQNLCPLLSLWSKSQPRGSVTYEETSMATKSGERREVSSSFAPLELPLLDSNPTTKEALATKDTNNVRAPYTIIVLRDISEQKRQERIKTEFVTTASHQLRTPLSSIKTSINLLLASVDEDFNPTLMRLLHNIRGSSMRMERLVNDLIELTNLQSGRVQLQRRYLEAVQVVQKAVELSRERLDTRQQQLKLNLPDTNLYVEADYVRISQVLGHLISNASKFSAAGKPIELKVEHGPAQQVVFSVRDEGIGIDAEEQALIFEKFYQSQVTENSNDPGGGLGLPLAKALVELNGGRLWLESTLGKGSTFYFSLPSAPAN